MQTRENNDLLPWILSALVMVIMGVAVAVSSTGPDAGSSQANGIDPGNRPQHDDAPLRYP